MKRQIAEARGRRGEDEAAQWLTNHGWSVLAQRVKTKVGEIDLIARKDALVAFIEVKWRAKEIDLDTAIDERRLARVAAAVEVVAHEYVQEGEDLRVDVLLLAPGHEPRHITNAWQP